MTSLITFDAGPYCGPAPDPATLWSSWNGDPALVAILGATGLAAALYHWRTGAGGHRQAALAGAAGVSVVAFLSPLCALTVALFAARGLHHLLIIAALGPALALAIPLGRRLAAPGFLALSGAIWAWHVPAVYAAAWDSATLYWVLQLALILPAWAFWSGVLAPSGDLGQRVSAVLPVAALAGQMGLIGAILTFAPKLLYPEHLVTTAIWGLTPLADQQLAGLIMWVPGMLPLALVAGVMLARAWQADGRSGPGSAQT